MSVIDMDQWKRTHARPPASAARSANCYNDPPVVALLFHHRSSADRWRDEVISLTRRQISLHAEIYKMFTSFRPWGDR